jgi:hypothetical protein
VARRERLIWTGISTNSGQNNEGNEGSDPDRGVMLLNAHISKRGHNEPAPMSAKTGDGWPAPAPQASSCRILRKNALESQ